MRAVQLVHNDLKMEKSRQPPNFSVSKVASIYKNVSSNNLDTQIALLYSKVILQLLLLALWTYLSNCFWSVEATAEAATSMYIRPPPPHIYLLLIPT